MEPGVIMATQNFKRNLLLILYREGKKFWQLTFVSSWRLREREKTSDGCSLFPPFGDPSLPACYPLTIVPLSWMEKRFFFSFLVLLWDLSPWPGNNPCPLWWTFRLLTTGMPGESLNGLEFKIATVGGTWSCRPFFESKWVLFLCHNLYQIYGK